MPTKKPPNLPTRVTSKSPSSNTAKKSKKAVVEKLADDDTPYTTQDECLNGLWEEWWFVLGCPRTKEELAKRHPVYLGFVVSTYLAHLAVFRQKRITQAEYDKCVNGSLLDVCWELVQKANANDDKIDEVELF